jgi:sugar porter (SP) family MFS transporter
MSQVVSAVVAQPAIRKPYVIMISLIASLGGFLFGYDINVMIGGLDFLTRHFHLGAMQLGFAVSSAMLGCGVGALTGGYIADHLGRKKSLAITAIVFAVGSIGTAVPATIGQFDFFRIVGGVGVGLASVVSPMYIAEISPAHLRGRLVTLVQQAILSGAVISVTICYLLARSGNWRAMFASEAVPAVFLLVGLTIVPESPRWLLEQNLVERAREVLGKIYLQREEIELGIQEIAESLTEEIGTFRELLLPGLRRALVICVVLAAFVQFTGISPLDFYLPVIFGEAGFLKSTDRLFQMIFVACWMWVCTVIAIWLVDRVGRRPLLLVGITGMAIGMALLGLLFHLQVKGELVVALTMFTIGCFIASLAPLFWLLTSELFPTRLRARGMALSSLTHWTSAFVVTQIIPSMLDFAKSRYHTIASVFWLFGVFCVIAVIFTYYMVPETKNRTLEEIGHSWIAG